MKRGVISAAIALAALGMGGETGLAQQQSEVTAVWIRQVDGAPPGWWRMDVPSAQVSWDIQLGDGCENAQPGAAALMVDGIGAQWLLLPDSTPGGGSNCRIEQSLLIAAAPIPDSSDQP